MMAFRDVVGYLAGTMATLAFLPQVIKTLRQKNTKGLSLGMYLLFCSGVGLWLIYGVMMRAWPLVISNAITLILAGTILLLKIKHG